MIYFVTGAKGQLGYDVVKRINHSGNIVYATDYDTIDITNRSQVLNAISECNPDVIIHCAAWTAVDQAEDDREDAYNVNVNGTRNIAEAARITSAKLIMISTDYVYDGKGFKEHKEGNLTSPTNYYGETKQLAEEEALYYDKTYVLRVSWLFGSNGNNFVKTMLRLAKTHKEISVVDDQIGSPTYTKDLARIIEDMCHSEAYGIYNVSNEGFCSWAEFAKFVFELKGVRTVVNGVSSTEYPTKAIRPLNSRMSKDKLEENGFERLPSWQQAVRSYISELERMGE